MPYHPSRSCASRGFTLIELMVVVALIAIGAAAVSLSLRDPAATRLEREAARLVALLEAARAESRALGVTVIWVPVFDSDPNAVHTDFRFVGLPPSIALPTRWLGPDLVPELAAGAKGLVLGPEPLIAEQSVTLRIDQKRLTLKTDGLGPFAVVPTDEVSLEAR